jgi:hypothetical protein
MTFTPSAFGSYVMGYRHNHQRSPNGEIIIVPEKIGMHEWKVKEVPFGFFDLPDAENVSAVLFSNSGTIAKFNRMGTLAGFGSSKNLHSALEVGKLGKLILPNKSALEAACAVADPYRSWSR